MMNIVTVGACPKSIWFFKGTMRLWGVIPKVLKVPLGVSWRFRQVSMISNFGKIFQIIFKIENGLYFGECNLYFNQCLGVEVMPQ